MNRTGIEWTDYTWNPITGCTYGCPHCYARKFAYRLKGRCGYPELNPFTPTFHPNRLEEPRQVKKRSKIFTCSMGEFFDSHAREEWRVQVYEAMRNAPRHLFQILTQQPRNIIFGTERIPKNCMVGVTVKHQLDLNRIKTLRDNVEEHLLFASFEPVMGEIDIEGELEGLDWVIVGSMTGQNQPNFKLEWVMAIISEAINNGIPVFMKDNLEKHYDAKYGAGYFKKIPQSLKHEFPQGAIFR